MLDKRTGRFRGGLSSVVLASSVLALSGCGASTVDEDQPKPTAARQYALQQQACELLQDSRERSMMSGAFEQKLMRTCYGPQGRPEAAVSQAAPSGDVAEQIQALATSFTDVPVNDPSLDTGGTTQSETSVVALGNVVCAAWNDAGEGFGANGFSGYGYSLDGGLTWTDGGPLPSGSGDVSGGDPTLAYSARDGVFYYGALSTVGLSLWRSNDNCQNFTYVGPISSSSGDDKELMAVDNSPSSPFFGRIYVGWTDFAGSGDRNIASYSDDGGLTWSAKAPMPGTGSSGQGMWPAIAPNGDVFFALLGFTGTTRTEWIYKSTDGGNSWVQMPDIAAGLTSPEDPSATSSCGRSALNGNIRNLPSPQIAVSANSGAAAGYIVHAVYPYDSDPGADASNVFYRRSLDGGSTWESEIQLNDDGTTTDQFFPALAVAQGGIVGVSWYDRRLDPANLSFDRYATYSTSDGVTWNPNQRISDVSSPVAQTNPNFDGLATCYHGDYDQLSSSGDALHVVWSDDRRVTSTGPNPDVYYDKLAIDTSAGFVSATPAQLGCSGQVQVSVSDQDLVGAGTQEVTVSATSGDAETLSLSESPADSGKFGGTITVSDDAVVSDDGVVEGSDGVEITFTYLDADDGTGNPAVSTAVVTMDCAGPVIGNVAADSVLGTSAVVSFDASEASDAQVDYGLSCAALDQSASQSNLSTNPSVSLSGLTQNTTYFFRVTATDALGNPTVDDNGGNCYSFTTKDSILSETFEDGLGVFTVESGLWHVAAGCASTLPGHSLPNSLYYGQDSVCNYDTGATNSGSVRSVPVTVDVASGAALQFSYFLQNEGVSTSFDVASASVIVDGGSPIVVAGTGGSGVALVTNSGVWQQASVDLTPLLGAGPSAELELVFNFATGDSVANAFEGFLVDDVEILATTVSCGSDADCDDQVDCTVDSCDLAQQTCVNTPDDTACDDGLFCNGAEVCGSGGCQAGATVACDDGVGCTTDSCDEATDSCTNTAADAACDDGLFCDGVETCDPVADCQTGIAVDCADGVSCTQDSCDEATDSCASVPDDSACDDGLFCDGVETCDPVADCQAGVAVDCADGVSCTQDSCDEAADSCANVPDDSVCDNGLFCDGSEVCDPALDCTAGSPPCAGGSCDETTDQCIVTCQDTFLEAEDMYHSTGGSTTDGWNIWSNGYISTNYDFVGGDAELTVVARGDYAGGAWPHMVVRIGGVIVYQTDVTASAWTEYPFTATTAAGVQEVRVQFTNDYYQPPADRNLYVDKVIVGCQSTGDTCSDQTQNGNETDVDCGGGDCPACPDGDSCLVDSDCQSNSCENNVCVVAATCDDQTQNGNETDVDCGGSDCPACPDGDSCLVDSDCQSSNCDAGVCAAPQSEDVTATLTVDTDWGGGYCVTLHVENNASQATTSWTVVLNTNQTSIYTSWNGNLSGNQGQVTITPISWNSVIQPGQTNSSIGFCANRPAGGGALPTVVDATGKY